MSQAEIVLNPIPDAREFVPMPPLEDYTGLRHPLHTWEIYKVALGAYLFTGNELSLGTVVYPTAWTPDHATPLEPPLKRAALGIGRFVGINGSAEDSLSNIELYELDVAKGAEESIRFGLGTRALTHVTTFLKERRRPLHALVPAAEPLVARMYAAIDFLPTGRSAIYDGAVRNELRWDPRFHR